MEPPCCTSYPNQPPVSLFQGTCQERDSREFLELQSKSATISREPGILCLMFICLLVCFPLCVGGVRAEVKIHCLPQSLATLLLRRYLSLNPELTDKARPASQGAQGTTASASPSLGLQMHYHSAWHFYAGRWGWGSELRSLCLPSKQLNQVCHLPRYLPTPHSPDVDPGKEGHRVRCKKRP